MTADPDRVTVVRCGKGKTEAARSLHGGESPWWVEITAPDGSVHPAILRTPSSRVTLEQIATNAAALVVAARHGLPAPRLLAAGATTTLETVLPGTSTWPAAPSVALLRSAGAAIARVHAVTIEPRPELPWRPRPIAVDDFAADRREGRMPTTALLRRADERVRAIEPPRAPAVFVHGDVWPGNTLVRGGEVCALIDWKTAGVGHPGVDLGELRKQVAILYDDDAPGHVLEGWELASGTRAAHVPYWDAVAALNTPTQLYSPHATLRRDAFLAAALRAAGPPPGPGRSGTPAPPAAPGPGPRLCSRPGTGSGRGPG
ncbi:phosphotransferase [Dactylosporangium sp. McL0621]|uniref:phosphotransferase n=1 Tax=Dactylosporangium sp. McL0621 TaxID=3415678 RepID=UPI003CE6CF50